MIQALKSKYGKLRVMLWMMPPAFAATSYVVMVTGLRGVWPHHPKNAELCLAVGATSLLAIGAGLAEAMLSRAIRGATTEEGRASILCDTFAFALLQTAVATPLVIFAINLCLKFLESAFGASC